MLKAELGEVNVHRADQIPLDEVDPENIPADKEILLFGPKAKVYALGVPNDEDTLGTRQIFVEEHADHFSQVTWRTYAKFIFLIPVLLPIAIFATVWRDYRDVASYYRTLDRENWELLKTLKMIPASTRRGHEQNNKLYNH